MTLSPTTTTTPSRSNLKDSVLIRNVLKSQRRERGDHTVLMNRDRGISSNLHLYLHLISPCAHTHTPPLLLSAFVSSSSQFPRKFCYPFFLLLLCLIPCLSVFVSQTYSLIIQFYLQFPPSLIFFPPSTPTFFSSASAPLGSCVLAGVVGGLALCRTQCLSSPRPSVCPPSPSVLN